MKKFAFVLIATITVTDLWAHPGHGNGNPLSPGHYLTSPEHATQITLAIAAGIILINWLSSKFTSRSQKN